MRHVMLSILLLTLTGSIFCLAGEGRALIYQPMTISESGSYVMTRDVSAVAGPAVRIQAPVVELDLNGFTMSASNAPVIIINDPAGEVVIRGGCLSGGTRGISQQATNLLRLRLQGMTVDGAQATGIFVQYGSLVEIVDCHVADVTESRGIHVAADNARVTGNTVSQVGTDGIYVQSARSLVEDNIVEDYNQLDPLWESVGIWVDGDADHIVADNRVIGNTFDGDGIRIDASDSVVVSNTVSHNGDFGIAVVGSGNLVSQNACRNVTQPCIWINGWGNTIWRNAVQGDGEGIVIGGQWNLVDGNISSTTSCALRFNDGNGHAYRDNMLRPSGVCGTPNTDAGGNIL